MAPPRSRLYFYAIFLACTSIIISLSKGSASIPLYQLLFHENGLSHTIFFDLRLPRTIAAFVVGGLLALAGSLMQLLLQNPLADPYVMGTSGGAAFITLILMYIGIADQWMLLGAWSGSLITIALVFLLTRKHRWQSHALLLSGIAIACAFSAGITCILLLSDSAHLHSMLFWLAGDLNETNFPYTGLIILLSCTLICMVLAPGLNILRRGENEAAALGLPSQHYRIILYLMSSLCTAAAVTIAGCIGFIGLIIPHLTRALIGYDQRITLPISILLGGSLLTLADTLSRTLFAPVQLPVGLLMTLIGVPIFIGLLQR